MPKSKTSFVLHSSTQRAPPFVSVDKNIYNIPFESIVEEWTAELIPASPLQDEGVYLSVKNKQAHYVDTVKVQFQRKPSLGIELLEIAGGREDGLGITIVSGLVPGGAAEESGVLPGDCIATVELIQPIRETTGQKELLSITEETLTIPTECLGYDATVEAICSLPPLESEDEIIALTLKRIRRRPKVTLSLQYPAGEEEKDIRLELFAGENLRRAMLVRGVKLNDPLARRFDSGGSGDCGAEGHCTTCAVSVIRGADLLNPQGITEKQMFRDKPRWRLACKAIVGYGLKEGELTVRVNPRQW